jgi:hypothetical protein
MRIRKFVRQDEGLVTIEWVGIAAVCLITAIAISGFIMEGADTAGGGIASGVEQAGAGAQAPALPVIDGQ